MWYLRLYYVAIFMLISLESSDPANSFQWYPDLERIYIGSVSGFGSPFRSGSRSRVLQTKIEKKIQQKKSSHFFYNKNCNYSSLWHYKGKLQEKPSALKRKPPALHTKKFIKFFYSFAPLDPDSDSESGSRDPTQSRSDPDQEH